MYHTEVYEGGCEFARRMSPKLCLTLAAPRGQMHGDARAAMGPDCRDMQECRRCGQIRAAREEAESRREAESREEAESRREAVSREEAETRRDLLELDVELGGASNDWPDTESDAPDDEETDAGEAVARLREASDEALRREEEGAAAARRLAEAGARMREEAFAAAAAVAAAAFAGTAAAAAQRPGPCAAVSGPYAAVSGPYAAAPVPYAPAPYGHPPGSLAISIGSCRGSEEDARGQGEARESRGQGESRGQRESRESRDALGYAIDRSMMRGDASKRMNELRITLPEGPLDGAETPPPSSPFFRICSSVWRLQKPPREADLEMGAALDTF